MNKKVIIILVIVIIGIIIIVNNRNKSIDTQIDYGRTIVNEEEIPKDDLSQRLNKLYSSNQFYYIVKSLIDNNVIKEEFIKSKNDLNNEFDLSKVGEYDGVLIKNQSQDDFLEIAIIYPKDSSKNENLISTLLFEYSKICNDSNIDYIRSSSNYTVEQNGEFSMLIISKNLSKIKDIIIEANQ